MSGSTLHIDNLYETMKIQIRHFLAIAIALYAFTPHLDAAGTALDAEFKQLYADITQAVRSMDNAKGVSFLSQNFSMVTPDGKVHHRAETQREMKVNADTTHKVRACSNTIEAITPIDENQVAVIVLQEYERDQAPLDAPDKPHTIKTSVVQREIWKKEAGAWKKQRCEEILTGPIFFDGKIIPD